MIRAISCPYFRRPFGWCVAVGGLGGLIGLGGGEFRLPVLMYGVGFKRSLRRPAEPAYQPRHPHIALAIRSGAVSLAALVPYQPGGHEARHLLRLEPAHDA
jgi:uncharacterized membrane protein YfcA